MGRHNDKFYPSKSITRLATADIEQFDARCKVFIAERKFEAFTDDKSEPNEVIYKVRLLADIPDDLERDAMHLINDLRSALDKAVHAASTSLGSTEPKYTTFPFGESEAHLKGQLSSKRGPFKGVPDALHPFLLGLRPWWGGNDLLRAFGDFSNPTKHQSILTTQFKFGGVGITHARGGSITFTRVGTIWNDAKDECEVCRLSKNSAYVEFQVPVFVAFNDAKGLGRKEFVPTIREVLGIVDGIILGLEAETSRLTRS